jgi:hypothetical protein
LRRWYQGPCCVIVELAPADDFDWPQAPAFNTCAPFLALLPVEHAGVCASVLSLVHLLILECKAFARASTTGRYPPRSHRGVD